MGCAGGKLRSPHFLSRREKAGGGYSTRFHEKRGTPRPFRASLDDGGEFDDFIAEPGSTWQCMPMERLGARSLPGISTVCKKKSYM